jgi:hypothetical protein
MRASNFGSDFRTVIVQSRVIGLGVEGADSRFNGVLSKEYENAFVEGLNQDVADGGVGGSCTPPADAASASISGISMLPPGVLV